LLLFGGFDIQTLLILVVVALIAMTTHEFAHNYVGYMMGDPVPAREGRLTLDPRVHINWVGFAMFVLIGFGILGSAPIAAHRMRNPRWGILAAVAAGPLSNLLLAVIFGVFFRLVLAVTNQANAPELLLQFLFIAVFFNVLLFVFNILPFFPLDGWTIVLALLPPDLARTWQSWQQYTYFAFFGLILLSFVGGPINILSVLIAQPTQAITSFLIGL
jgi:Zn-dependent protease